MNVEPPETLVIIESIVYKSNGFAIDLQGNPVTRKSKDNHTPIDWDI